MELLLGLIGVVAVFALVRSFLPARTLPAGAALGAVAVALLAYDYRELVGLEFWSGLIGFVAIMSALMVVIHPNPMVSVLFLILNLFCIALFFLILDAQFLAVIQVIIYAGAIMVLFVFVVMLLNLKTEEGLRLGGGPQRSGAIVLGAAFAALMFYAIRNRGEAPYFDPGPSGPGFGTARDLGGLLFTRYQFAFDAASILLIAAMIGAVVLAKRKLR
ncbi:MAG TPA: NADH-quinone oxidoreductase subunit J [Candidatus Dormibacteraeota bacterium]|nr:NADH-quinone oxidoreductase subunit J [Candidatus Dormibacteraeota bacterium]